MKTKHVKYREKRRRLLHTSLPHIFNIHIINAILNKVLRGKDDHSSGPEMIITTCAAPWLLLVVRLYDPFYGENYRIV